MFDELFYDKNADGTLEKVNLEFASLLSLTIFVNHVYGLEMEVDSLSFRTLVEMNWIALKYGDKAFSSVLIPKLELMKEKTKGCVNTEVVEGVRFELCCIVRNCR